MKNNFFVRVSKVNSIKYLSYKPSKAGAYVKPVKDPNPNLEDLGDGIKGANTETLDLPDDACPF